MTNNYKWEVKLSVAFATIILGLFLTNLSYLIQRKTGISFTVVSNICKGIILLALVPCIQAFIGRFNRFLAVVLVLLILVILSQNIFFSRNTRFNSTLFTFFINVLPAILIFSTIKDYKVMIETLRKYALGISLVLFFVVTAGVISNFDSNYAMGFANCMILPTIVLVDELFNEHLKKIKRVVLMLFVISNVFSVVIYGSRGAFVAIGLFSVVLIIVGYFRTKRAVYLAAIAFLVLVIAFLDPILVFSLQLLTNRGYSSRTLRLMLNNIGHDSGRFEIWGIILSEIAERPFLIRGINADFLLVGSYSHNYFIELIFAFGIILGGSICIYIIVSIIKTIRKGFKSDESRIEFLLLFSFFPVCLWSGSIWTNIYFWAWLSLKHVSRYYIEDEGVI